MKMQKTLAKNLRARLELEQISVQELAARTSICRTAISEYLRGCGNPRLDTLEILCDALGLTPNDLLLHDSHARVHNQLAHILATLPGVSEFPIDAQAALCELYMRMAEIYHRYMRRDDIAAD